MSRARPIRDDAPRSTPPRDPSDPWVQRVEVLASIGGLAGLIGGLLYYFGWARTSATFEHFGIPIELLDLSFQDYLLRSVQAAYRPLFLIGVLGLLVLPLHRVIVRSEAAGVVGMALQGLGAVGVLRGCAAVLGWLPIRVSWPAVPALLLVSMILVLYGARLRLGPRVGRRRDTVWGARPAVTVGMLLLLTFWTVSNYASYHGRNVATAVANDLPSRPGVVVYSTTDLRLRGEGVVVRRITGADSAYRFCVSGLRLLTRSGDRQVLVPEEWQSGRDPVAILDEADDLRIEYFTSREPTTCD